MHRRALLLGLSAACLPGLAHAARGQRLPVPGSGGTVIVPRPYEPQDPGGGIVAHRNRRSTMGGYTEIDGALFIGAAGEIALSDFHRSLSGIATSRWHYEPDPSWRAPRVNGEDVAVQGPLGPEVHRPLLVHDVGFWGVSDKPGLRYSARTPAGLHIGVFIFDSHGGVNGARRIARAVDQSFQRSG